jgi:hypothetical protein
VADICTLEDGSFISGGLADGSIVVFDNKYELIGKGTIFVALLACEAFRIFFFLLQSIVHRQLRRIFFKNKNI